MTSNELASSKYDLIIFDLDGTLIDSRLDLANSVNYTRLQLGLSALENELIYSYVGDGASTLVCRALGREPKEAAIKQALEIFLQHYKRHLLDNLKSLFKDRKSTRLNSSHTVISYAVF